MVARSADPPAPGPSVAELLSPENLVRIDSYSLLARVAMEGFVSGLHRSLYHGFGGEFFQYRSYVPGDDLKYLDWKIYGRRDRFYTKVFQEETNMNCCIALDLSESMAYQGTRAACSKFRYACMAAACLAYLAARQGDNVGLYAYHDRLESSLHPGHRTGGLRRLLAELHRLKPGERANHRFAFDYLAEHLNRRGLVVILSDLLEAEDILPGILRRLRFAHHDCIVLHILDQDEIDFPFTRTTRFVDSETNHEVVTAPELARDAFLQGMARSVESVRLACLEQQVDYLRISSADDLGNTLAAYLHRREALR